MQRTREAAERVQTEHDGLNYTCPNLLHKKGRAIPTAAKRAPSESDKFPSHLVIGQSNSKSEFDVFQELVPVTQMCLPKQQIKINDGMHLCFRFEEHLCKSPIINGPFHLNLTPPFCTFLCKYWKPGLSKEERTTGSLEQ